MTTENTDPTMPQQGGMDPWKQQPGTNQPGMIPPGTNPQPGIPGQPLPGVQPGAGGWQGMGASAPVAPKKRFPIGRIIQTLVTLLILGGIAFALSDRAKEDSMMKIGNCITATKGADKTTGDTPASIACDDASKPSYVVVQKLTTGTCADPYSAFEYKDPDDKDKVQRTYCLMPNLVKGSCYKDQEVVGQPLGALGVACTDSAAQIKISDRIDGVDDKSRCATGSTAVVYNLEPKRTYCVAQPS